MGKPCRACVDRVEIVSITQRFNAFYVALEPAANHTSYIVYIALLCMYLVLVIFFFPETRWVPSPQRVLVNQLSNQRRM